MTKEVPKVTPKKFVPELDPGFISDKAEVLKAVNNPKAYIVDCRNRPEWVGDTSAPGTHVPEIAKGAL